MKTQHRFIWRWILIILLVGMAGSGGATVLAQGPARSVGVYYIGPEDTLAHAITLSYPYLVRVDRPELARVFVVNGAPPAAEDLAGWNQLVQREQAGLVLFMGPGYPLDSQDLRDLLGMSFPRPERTDVSHGLRPGEEEDSLATEIAWSSAPPLRGMTIVGNPNLLRPIILTDSGDPVVQRVRGREGPQAFLVAAWLEDATNAGWDLWPYYNYLVYRLIAEAAGDAPVLSFADYPPAPVPHGTFRLLATVGGLGLIIAAISVLFVMRRMLFLNPGTFIRRRDRLNLSVGMADQGLWDLVGFHRPLAGMLLLLGVGIWIFFPLLGFNAYWRPQVLIPWPQALSFWEWVALLLEVVWLVLDLGTGLAAVRYFALFRVNSPREAFRYFQFYFWWQLISGAVQLGTVTWLAAAVFPNTGIAHLSYFFFAHALIQFPGVLSIFRLFFRAMQRFDYEQLITLVPLLAVPLLQIAAVAILRPWGAARPFITEPVAAALGLGLGAVLGEWVAFGLGIVLYRRIGYGLRWLVQPSFDWRVAGRLLGFGARLALGDVVAPLGLIAQAVWIAPRVPGYEGILNTWNLALAMLLVYQVLQDGLYADLLPTMTQSYSHGYQTLARYYLGQGLRYGMWVGLFALASLGAVGDALILGVMGGGYADAAKLVGLLLLWGLLQTSLGGPDAVLVAAGRPEIRSSLIVIETGVRLGLLFFLAPRWQLVGLLVAYTGGIVVRVVLTWVITVQWMLRPRINYWQTFIAPVGAALVIYYGLRGLGALFWQPTPTASLILAVAASLPALLGYAWLTGVLGGWDEGGLEELRRAVTISGAGRPVGELIYRAIRWGAGISGLHGRFEIGLRPYAEEEAHALTFRRAPLE